MTPGSGDTFLHAIKSGRLWVVPSSRINRVLEFFSHLRTRVSFLLLPVGISEQPIIKIPLEIPLNWLIRHDQLACLVRVSWMLRRRVRNSIRLFNSGLPFKSNRALSLPGRRVRAVSPHDVVGGFCVREASINSTLLRSLTRRKLDLSVLAVSTDDRQSLEEIAPPVPSNVLPSEGNSGSVVYTRHMYDDTYFSKMYVTLNLLGACRDLMSACRDGLSLEQG
ncbi:hypothetical protein PM082_016731 [Marasmius tenuissimus]|nr:hypothetical protein PM082_016731 [Marasmius tenuissimus]